MITRKLDQMPEPTMPGEMLTEEFLVPLNMTQSALAAKMGVDVQIVNGICRGRRAITAHTALLLAQALNTTPQFWMNLQAATDLWEAKKEIDRRRTGPTPHTPSRASAKAVEVSTQPVPPAKARPAQNARLGEIATKGRRGTR